MKLRSFLSTAALLGAFLAVQPARAQSPAQPDDSKNELYIGVGVLSVQEILSVFTSVFEQAIRNGFSGEKYTENDDSTHVLGIGYNRYITPRWTLGGIFNFVRYTRTATSTSGKVEQGRDQYFTLMARTDFRWVNKHYVQLYSSLALGGNYIYEYDSSTHLNHLIPAGQIDLLGVRVGHDFGGFLELGFGWNGVIAVGISGKL